MFLGRTTPTRGRRPPWRDRIGPAGWSRVPSVWPLAFLQPASIIADGALPWLAWCLDDGSGAEFRTFLVPRKDFSIDHESWQVTGLAGTGSKDIVITDAFVP